MTLPRTVAPVVRGATASATPLPWDSSASLGAFVATWVTLLFVPRRTFAELPPHVPGRWRPFFFTLLCLSTGTVIRFLRPVAGCLRELVYRVQEDMPAVVAIRSAAFLLAPLVLVPVVQALVRVFVIGSVDLLLLRVLGAAPRGVEPTLRVGCYASAPGVLHALPYVWCVGELWQAWLRIVGYRAVHGNRGFRTAVVVLVVLLTLVAYLATHFALTVNEAMVEQFQRTLGVG